MKTKLTKILEWLIATDDNNRNKAFYDVKNTLDKAEEKIINLKLKDLK